VTAGGMSDGGIGAREVLTGTWREMNSATNSADVNSIRSQLPRGKLHSANGLM
jgi:hypothetical protein